MISSVPVAVLGFLVYLTVIAWRFKKGRSMREQLVPTVFWIYAVAVISVTFFPLPIQPRVLQVLKPVGNHQDNNFVPFHDISTMAIHDRLYDLIRQVGGNIVLFLPFGFLLPLVSARFSRIGKSLAVGMASSATIEMMQWALGILFGYNYRTVDVDDFMLNTCGFLIGYIVLGLVKRSVTVSKLKPEGL